MKTANYNMRINPRIKSKSEQIYSNLGLNLSDAINVFLEMSIIENGFPFRVNLPKDTFRSIVKKDDNSIKISRKDMFNCAKGKFVVSNDFNDPIEDFMEYM